MEQMDERNEFSLIFRESRKHIQHLVPYTVTTFYFRLLEILFVINIMKGLIRLLDKRLIFVTIKREAT